MTEISICDLPCSNPFINYTHWTIEHTKKQKKLWHGLPSIAYREQKPAYALMSGIFLLAENLKNPKILPEILWNFFIPSGTGNLKFMVKF